MGVRDPAARSRQRFRGEGFGDHPEGLGREVHLQAAVIAERIPVDLDRERRLRRDDHVPRAVDVVDVPAVHVASRRSRFRKSR